MPVQPHTFNTRVRDHSTLSPQALLVALTISDLRYKRRLKPHEPLTGVTLVDIAALCHMPRSSFARWLKEATDSGWIQATPVYRDGRQMPSEYRLEDPTADTQSAATGTQNHAKQSPRYGTLKRGKQSPSIGTETALSRDTVVRSNNNGAGDDAAPRGGVGSDEQGTPPVAEAASADAPAPALEASADTPAEHVKEDPARRSALTRALWQRGLTREEYGYLPPEQRQQLEDELLNDWQAQHRDKQAGMPDARATDNDTAAEPPMHIPPARLTNPLHHRCPDCGAPIGRRCHRPMGYCPARRRLAETAALQPA